ncbi:MAG: heme exporter protein CcmD [Nevskia sp.]|nr:heme exporter protein CcmD [Nevskia sp.]
MNEKYALYVWSSYGLTLAVLMWNLLAPYLRRNELRRHLSEPLEEVE